MMLESWKDFGSYKVSNLGRVSLPSGRITEGWNRNGYKAVYVGGNKEYVHRLVAKSFCEGWFEGAVVDHIDRNILNNWYLNLQWVSLSNNAKNSKVRRATNRISDKDIASMLELSQNFGLNNTEIASVLQTDRRNVSRILNGRSRVGLTGLKGSIMYDSI